MKNITVIIIIFLIIFDVVCKIKKNNIYVPEPEIPRVINKVFIQHSGGLENSLELEKLKHVHDDWLVKNSGYEIRYWGLNDCRSFLKQLPSIYLHTFDKLSAYAAKTDFFRYCLIYKNGGWYSDWKEQCMKQGLLEDLSSGGTEYVFMRSNPKSSRFKHCVDNGFFGSIPNNPILKQIILECIKNTNNEYYGDNPLSTVGPCVMGKFTNNPSYNLKTKNGYYSREDKSIPGGYFIYDNELIIIHKCDGCGDAVSHNWTNGNNYSEMWKERKFFN